MARENILWVSEPIQIGKHLWRVGVGSYNICGPNYDKLTRCTFYQWCRGDGVRVDFNGGWQESTAWPSYDGNDTYNGLPRTLDALYRRELPSIDRWLERQPRMNLDNQGSLFT